MYSNVLASLHDIINTAAEEQMLDFKMFAGRAGRVKPDVVHIHLYFVQISHCLLVGSAQDLAQKLMYSSFLLAPP